MTALLWFLAFYFVFITGVFVGMLVGYYARNKVKPTADAEIIDHGEIREMANREPAFGGSATPPVAPYVAVPKKQTVPPIEGDAEIIERPDARRLNELEEDETVRDSKSAVAETLKKFPSVQEILAAKAKFEKGLHE